MMSNTDGNLLNEGSRYNVNRNGDKVYVMLKGPLFREHEQVATATCCYLFGLLKACGVPVAFEQRTSLNGFTAKRCDTLWRMRVNRINSDDQTPRSAVLKSQLFPQLTLLIQQARGNESIPNEVGWLVKRAFLVLEKAFQLRGLQVGSVSFEIGLLEGIPRTEGGLMLTGILDFEAFEFLENGQPLENHHDRFPEQMEKLRRRICELSAGFLPLAQQTLVVWRASDKDKLDAFREAWDAFVPNSWLHVAILKHTCSMHKEPAKGYMDLARIVQQANGNCVIIAYVGRSNGLGPVLAANTQVPVIAVPASAKEFPDDVWSSLRMPSEAPLMTVLDPKNAMLAALNMLALSNPALYAALRLKLEERLINVVRLS